MQTHGCLLQRCDVVWLLCIAVIGSALLLCSHPQTIKGSQWTTSARENTYKVSERHGERERGGGGVLAESDDEKV